MGVLAGRGDDDIDKHKAPIDLHGLVMEAGAAIQRLEEQNKMLLEQAQAMMKRMQAVEEGRSRPRGSNTSHYSGVKLGQSSGKKDQDAWALAVVAWANTTDNETALLADMLMQHSLQPDAMMLERKHEEQREKRMKKQEKE